MNCASIVVSVFAICGLAYTASGQAGPIGPGVKGEVLYNGARFSAVDAMRAVVRTAEDFDALWRRAQANRLGPESKPPTIDFSKSMVLVVALGRQRSAGVGSAVLSAIEDRGGVLQINADVRLEGPNCGDGFPAVEYPTLIVKVPISWSTPVFRDRVTMSC